jgi:hypothetical protein
MTRERFEILAEAFGGDVARWPAAEREGAALLMAAEPAWAQAALARAAVLDAALAACAPPRASAALTDRIVATAPRPRPSAARWGFWLAPAGLGAGLAAACAAGVLLGGRIAPLPHPPSETAQAAAIADEDALASTDVDV